MSKPSATGPLEGSKQEPRISRATSLRLERQRSAGQSSIVQGKQLPKVEPSEPVPKARDPSPTKLPVGSFRRANSVRQPSELLGQAQYFSHKRHGSASSVRQQPDLHANRPGQGPSLGPVKEALPQKDGGNQSKPPTHRKVTPTEREFSHTRTLSKESSEQRLAPKQKPKEQATKLRGSIPDVKQTPSHARRASSSHTIAQSQDQKGPSAPHSAAQRSEVVTSHSLLESSLELLQLHAIHCRAAKTQLEWTESARKFYESQFKELVAFKEALQSREKDLLMQRNACAVIDWGSCSAGDTLERRVQVLSSTLDDTWQLSSPTGRYTSVAQAFEHWYENAAKSQERQSGTGKSSRLSISVTEGLGDGWKAEVDSLQDNLLKAANDILSLGDIDGESDLARVITLLLELIKNMLEELELMEWIEQSVAQQQQGWVQSSLNELQRAI